jgi:hypothetical protein
MSVQEAVPSKVLLTVEEVAEAMGLGRTYAVSW